LNDNGVRRLLEEVAARPPETETPRIDGMTPALVLEPDDASGCARALALCHEESLAVVPVGGGTRLALGNFPARLDAYLDMRRLAGVEDHIPGDLTVAVRAGTTLQALQDALRGAGQFLPLDAPCPSRATIGGILSAGEAGYRRRPGARPRDLLLGFEAVTADGNVIKAGGRVVKNVAGYELMKLIVGSFGTLAVITRAFLRLRAIPEQTRTFACPVRSAAHAGTTWRQLRDLALPPEGAALLNPQASAELDLEGWNFVLRFEGLEEEVDGAAAELSGIAKAGPVPGEPWDALRDFPLGESALVLRGLVAPDRTFGLAESWQDGGALLAFPDSGILFSRTEALDALADRREQAGLHAAGLVVERLPEELKREIDVFGEPPGGFGLMKRIKEKLDPKGILSPGRFVGRL